MRIKKTHLMRIVRGDISLTEARKLGYVLSEAVPAPDAGEYLQSDPQMLDNTSIDAQVDKFILQADGGGSGPQEDVPPAPVPESFLREADDDAGAGGDAPPATPLPPKKKMQDLVGFVTDIAQLVEKSEELLDVKGAIVRRALNYVTKNYDEKQSKDVERMLDANFDVRIDPSADTYADEDVPMSAGAGGPPGGGT